VRKNYSKLESIIAPIITKLGYEFVGSEQLNLARQTIVRIFVDKHDSGASGNDTTTSSISVEDCRIISDQVSAVLDVENSFSAPYTLEISSPGLDRKIFTVEQLCKQHGKLIKFKLYAAVSGRKNFNGVLASVDLKAHTCVIMVKPEKFSSIVSNAQQPHGKPLAKHLKAATPAELLLQHGIAVVVPVGLGETG
jgi:ribosome maturation factor RimP